MRTVFETLFCYPKPVVAAINGHAIAAAETLAALPPLAFALTKRQVREPVMKRVREDGPQFDVAVQELWEAPTTLAAIRAYVARTFKRSLR